MLQYDIGLSRICEYLGKQYQVISVLDNDLLLVLPIKDLENDKFPLQPVVIPDNVQRI